MYDTHSRLRQDSYSGAEIHVQSTWCHMEVDSLSASNFLRHLGRRRKKRNPDRKVHIGTNAESANNKRDVGFLTPCWLWSYTTTVTLKTPLVVVRSQIKRVKTETKTKADIAGGLLREKRGCYRCVLRVNLHPFKAVCLVARRQLQLFRFELHSASRLDSHTSPDAAAELSLPKQGTILCLFASCISRSTNIAKYGSAMCRGLPSCAIRRNVQSAGREGLTELPLQPK